MKKNLYIANLLVAGLMTFTGCTDGFESDNANKAGYTPELQEYDLQKYVLNLGVMQQGIYFNYDWGKGTDWTFQTIQNLGHDMFAGYFHDMNNSFNDKNSVYALNDGWTGSAWTYTYGYIMTAAQKSEKINQEQKGLLGVTKILKVELMHRIADTYGPIVYTKFGQEEGDNVDSQEAAYRQFFKDLDEGVKLINEYKKANAALEPFAAADILMPVKHLLPDNFHIGINVSAGCFLAAGFEKECLNLVKKLGNDKIKLVLELTERNPIPVTPEARAIFDSLHQHNITFALDDFGTGYATYRYLQAFPVDFIKIDKSFVQMASVDEISGHIVDNIVELARKPGLSIVAEGVETQEQADLMIGKGVHFLQGYLYSPPVPGNKFIRKVI